MAVTTSMLLRSQTILYIVFLGILPARGWTSSSRNMITRSQSSFRRKDGTPAVRCGVSSTCTNMSSSSDLDMKELSRRIETLRSSSQTDDEQYRQLPVICFDSLLPGQKLEGKTTDPVFCSLLKELGLGGEFVMISINNKQRKARRNGCLCRLEIMDANSSRENALITAVAFVIAGQERCRVVGQSEKLQRRIGRWRGCYDPDGEETRLGFGEELFAPAINGTVSRMNNDDYASYTDDHSNLSFTDSSTCWVDRQLTDPDDNDDAEVQELSVTVIDLLDEFETLASNVRTYENTNVVAATRVKKGYPGLHVNPDALLRQVKSQLGPRPHDDATSLAIWGAAFINPIPALGVSPEIRGHMLELSSARQRLLLLKSGTERAIRNLRGTDPL